LALLKNNNKRKKIVKSKQNKKKIVKSKQNKKNREIEGCILRSLKKLHTRN